MSRHGVLFLAGLCLAGFVSVTPVSGDEKRPEQGKPIDVALCLDTSNSMDGLIDSAKRKLWDIVNDLAKAKPAPYLRVALFSYGNDGYDRTTGWVRKELDLTTDLDKVSEKLFGLRTNGGTELVARVSRDALNQLAWNPEPGALKLMFVCGNEPANQDQEVHLKDVAEQAARKGIIINTIYCGSPNSDETKGWRDFATLAEGRFACIDQAKGTVAIATPMDKELAELGNQLNTTYVFFGREGKLRMENQLRQDANATQLGLDVAASRSISKSTGVYRNADADLVDKLKEDPKFDVKKVPEAELPENLKKMTPEQREKYVKEQLSKREQLQKKLGELAKKREEYIQNEMKKNPSGPAQALDEAVRGTLREQAQKKGIQIP